jgi:hypothetical protein
MLLPALRTGISKNVERRFFFSPEEFDDAMDIYAENGAQPSFFPPASQQTVYWDATGLFAATSCLVVIFLCVSVGWLCFRVFSEPFEIDNGLEDSCDEEA